MLQLLTVRTSRYGKNSFRFEAARVWNNLPNEIRCADKLKSSRGWSTLGQAQNVSVQCASCSCVSKFFSSTFLFYASYVLCVLIVLLTSASCLACLDIYWIGFVSGFCFYSIVATQVALCFYRRQISKRSTSGYRTFRGLVEYSFVLLNWP